jgi:hypothetical protein
MKRPNQRSQLFQVLSAVSSQCGEGLSKVSAQLAARRHKRSQDAAQRAREYDEARQRLEAARERFADEYWLIYNEYEPDDRVAISDIPRMRFSQILPLVEAEMYRIAALLDPIFKKAEFDLETKDRRIRSEMNAIWNEAQGNLQRKAFAGVRLPLGLVWRGAQLALEQQEWKEKGHSGPAYYGVISNRCYGSSRAVLAP